ARGVVNQACVKARTLHFPDEVQKVARWYACSRRLKAPVLHKGIAGKVADQAPAPPQLPAIVHRAPGRHSRHRRVHSQSEQNVAVGIAGDFSADDVQPGWGGLGALAEGENDVAGRITNDARLSLS